MTMAGRAGARFRVSRLICIGVSIIDDGDCLRSCIGSCMVI